MQIFLSCLKMNKLAIYERYPWSIMSNKFIFYFSTVHHLSQIILQGYPFNKEKTYSQISLTFFLILESVPGPLFSSWTASQNRRFSWQYSFFMKANSSCTTEQQLLNRKKNTETTYKKKQSKIIGTTAHKSRIES